MKPARLFLAFALACSATPALAQEADPRPGPKLYTETGEAAAPVADAYFDAYIALAWDRVETMLADDASFCDPTAEPLFGAVSAVGKQKMMARFREGYAVLKGMSFDTTRVIHSGGFAIYEGQLTWTIGMGSRDVTSTTPMVTIIEVRNGKVISHRDYVDYMPFITAERASRPKPK